MTWLSPMRDVLLPSEEDRIRAAWTILRTIEMPPSAQLVPQNMLAIVTDTIMACYEVRQAINEAWYAASKRARPLIARPKATPKQLLSGRATPEQLLSAQIGISPEEIERLITAELSSKEVP